MPDTIEARVERWMALCADPGRDPFRGMAEAGLFEPAASYSEIARTKAALVRRTGLLGVGGVWGGRHLIGRHFLAGFGSADQQAAWRGRAMSVAISEPDVGAHPKLLRTTAMPDGEGFRINGEKAWVSNGPWAEVIIVLAITSQDQGRKRYSAFLVASDTPGLSMTDMPGFHALRPSRHCRMVLSDCRVPRSAMLGPEGEAYERMAMPFRDVEDAVGTFGTLGAFRFLLDALAPAADPAEAHSISLGTLLALTAVFEAGAAEVVAALDAGRLDSGSATLAGLRVLALDMLQRARSHAEAHAARDPAPVQQILADLDATLSIARGPRMARLARLGGGGRR
ncbi:MAG: acyl-CoA dehydrogenase [Acetobacteraceae bacterium]